MKSSACVSAYRLGVANLRASAQDSLVSWCLYLKNNNREQRQSQPSGGLTFAVGNGIGSGRSFCSGLVARWRVQPVAPPLPHAACSQGRGAEMDSA